MYLICTMQITTNKVFPEGRSSLIFAASPNKDDMKASQFQFLLIFKLRPGIISEILNNLRCCGMEPFVFRMSM